MKPKRLYKFMSANFGMRALWERRLRISRLEELNDDFEFIGIALALKEDRIALRAMRKQLSEMNGVICMSQTWSSPLMWAHYADSHKGMVLGFDVIPESYFPVRYVEKRPTLESMGLSRFEDMTEKDMGILVGMKAKGWEYEEEYRAYIGLQSGIKIDGQVHYFMDFGLGLELKEIIVGSRFSTERHEVIKAANKPDVDIFMARGDFEDFKVVRNRDVSMWLWSALMGLATVGGKTRHPSAIAYSMRARTTVAVGKPCFFADASTFLRWSAGMETVRLGIFFHGAS